MWSTFLGGMKITSKTLAAAAQEGDFAAAAASVAFSLFLQASIMEPSNTINSLNASTVAGACTVFLMTRPDLSKDADMWRNVLNEQNSSNAEFSLVSLLRYWGYKSICNHDTYIQPSRA